MLIFKCVVNMSMLATAMLVLANPCPEDRRGDTDKKAASAEGSGCACNT